MNKQNRFNLLIFFSMLTGLFIAWLDNRPGWNDTGITAGLLVVTSAIFGYWQPARPWIWVLTVSSWIPVYAISTSGDFRYLFIFLFGFAGSYLGAAVKNNKPAV